MNFTRLKLITFDVTGTILQFRKPIGKQYSEIAALHGVKCDKNTLMANFKTHWYQLTKEHPNFGKETGLGWEQWWKLIVFRTFKDADVNVNEKKLDLVATDIIELYKSADSWQPCYGALDLLSYLRNKDVPLGVISNFDPRLPILLDDCKLTHYFKFVLASFDAGFEKPDKRIFDEAIKQSNISGLKANECFHIGDNFELDYTGATNAGWNAALIEDRKVAQIQKKYKNMNPNHVYRNLYELHKCFVESDSKSK